MVPNGGGRVTVLEVRADTARDYDKTRGMGQEKCCEVQ